FLLEHAPPQLRERHLEPPPAHLDDVRADREHGRADGDVAPHAERDGPEERHYSLGLRPRADAKLGRATGLIARILPTGRSSTRARRTESSCACGKTASRTSCSTPRAPCSTSRARARTPRAAPSTPSPRGCRRSRNRRARDRRAASATLRAGRR